MERKILYDNRWVRLVKLDDWFIASEPAASKDNKTVAVLAYRKVQDGPTSYKNEFLAHYELNPAHMTDNSHQVAAITGNCETGDPLYHARMELFEEGGYKIPTERFKCRGIVCPAKTSCSRMYLYTVRIYKKDKHLKPSGDGGPHERKEYASWVDRKTMVNCKDPYVHTMILRAGL